MVKKRVTYKEYSESMKGNLSDKNKVALNKLNLKIKIKRLTNVLLTLNQQLKDLEDLK